MTTPAVTLALAASPILLCSALILVMGRSATVGASVAGCLALGLGLFIDDFALGADGVGTVARTTAILVLSAALVVVPGLYLNAVLRGQGVIDVLVRWIQSIPLDPAPKALLLLLGVLPAIESLTGFGVSLFLGVPVFFSLFSPERAYRLSLLGMNIMPWGTLALATVVGASLSGYSVLELGSTTALTSALVYPTIGVLALVVLGGKALLKQHVLSVILLGFGLSAHLYVFNRLGFVETGGILSGVAISVAGFALFRWLREPSSERDAKPVALPEFRYIFPYILLISLLLISRIIPELHQWLGGLMVLSSGGVRLRVFTSPGWALASSALVVFLLRPIKIDHAAVWKRTRTALLSLGCFIFLAQVMNGSTMIATLAQGLQHVQDNDAALAAASALLGMASGFLTGSNLGANALAMGMQQQIGQVVNQGLLFSALQNSAAGAGVFMSLPIIVLVMAIAKDSMLDRKGAPAVSERDLLLFCLRSGCPIYVALLVSFFIARDIVAMG